MKIQILGTRGIPAQHGGFETFTENFATYLQEKGWSVTVFCQKSGEGPVYEDEWNGIKRIHIPVKIEGALGTVVFDWKSTLNAIKCRTPVLTLGYNTAVFCCLYRLFGMKNVINMDGIEWKRDKWSKLERFWLFCNEKLGGWFGNHLVADHPEIKNHLNRFLAENKISVIPYSADIVLKADEHILSRYNLSLDQYCLIIARPEPENSILEIVKAFSSKKRDKQLVVLGNYFPEENPYHAKIFTASSEEVTFLGAIYDKKTVQALRYFATLYIHGHTVGGTNPSLVEALGAGNAVLAHDNKFNRWVAGDGAEFFKNEAECTRQLNRILQDSSLLDRMRSNSRSQMKSRFTHDTIHRAYEDLLVSEFPCTMKTSHDG